MSRAVALRSPMASCRALLWCAVAIMTSQPALCKKTKKSGKEVDSGNSKADETEEAVIEEAVAEEALTEVMPSKRIAAGNGWVCVLEEGKPRCFGISQGQSAIGAANEVVEGTEPYKDETFESIDGSAWQVCALNGNGAATCWGDLEKGGNSEGPANGRYSAISVGMLHVCAIDKANGNVVCWGKTAKSNQPPGTCENHIEKPAAKFSKIASGSRMTCGVDDSGKLRCWFCVPDDIPINSAGVVPRPDGFERNCEIDDLAVGGQTVCVTWKDCQLAGKTRCWGRRSSTCNAEFTVLDGEGDRICGLGDDNRLVCWESLRQGGKNFQSGKEVSQMTVGDHFACGLDTDDVVDCWSWDMAMVPLNEDKATQSSNREAKDIALGLEGYPAKAVDGNVNTMFSGKSCTHTKGETRPWWAVDLGSNRKVEFVRLLNRADESGRLNKWQVFVCDKDDSIEDIDKGDDDYNAKNTYLTGCEKCAEYEKNADGTAVGAPSGEWIMAECEGGAEGRHVVVALDTGRDGSEVLTLCEVEVFADEVIAWSSRSFNRKSDGAGTEPEIQKFVLQSPEACDAGADRADSAVAKDVAPARPTAIGGGAAAVVAALAAAAAGAQATAT